jgi:hypothetical protein
MFHIKLGCGLRLKTESLHRRGMSSLSTTNSVSLVANRGKIIEAEVKVSVDPGEPLPLACALYALETQTGVWLCAYYGSNRSVFDYLPQRGAVVDEKNLGITFHSKEFVSRKDFKPEVWEEFKKKRFMSYSGHGG